MTVFLALFRDAWRRARDRKTVTILFILGLLFAVTCASFEFGRPVAAESLKHQLSKCSVSPQGAIGHGRSNWAFLLGSALKRAPKVRVREPVAEDDLPLGLANVCVAELELPDLDEFDRLVRQWHDAGGTPPADPSISARERGDYLESMLRGHGWETVLARPQGDETHRFLVAAATDHLSDLEGQWKLGAIFGAGSVDIEEKSPAEVVVLIEKGISWVFAGFIGMLVLLAAFGGAVPDLLQKGQLDLVLARPIGRTRLLLYSYAGALLTVFLVTASIFLACALTFSLRSGHISFAFVGCAVTATAIFAALHPVAMLFGYLTRNVTFATIASASCWGLAEMLAGGKVAVATFVAKPSIWTDVLDWAYRFVPKTSDISNLGARWLAKTELSPQAFERFKEQFPVVSDPGSAIGSTAIFAAVFLLITALLFRRRDC